MRLSSRDSSKPDRLNPTRPGIDRPTSDGFGLHSPILVMIIRSFRLPQEPRVTATQYANYRGVRGQTLVTSVTGRLTFGRVGFRCGKGSRVRNFVTGNAEGDDRRNRNNPLEPPGWFRLVWRSAYDCCPLIRWSQHLRATR